LQGIPADGYNAVFERMLDHPNIEVKVNAPFALSDMADVPVYYSGPDGQLCAFMDRLFYSNAPKFAGKVGAAIVNARRSGTTASFERLNQYFLISNMVVPGSQYWNATHGFTPDDVRKDLEGLQTMRTLAKNIAWLIKSIDAGKKAGIAPPKYEDKVFTNFI
jgi:hypothetical protein